jgi:hypothetical protein
VWRGVVLASILLFALPYSLPASEAFDPSGRDFNWRGVVAVVAAVVIAAQVLAVLVLLLWRTVRPHPGETGIGYLVLAVLAAAASLFAWTWWLAWRIGSSEERYFLYYRVTDLTAGMSPLVPMGLVALASLAVGGFSLGQADIARRNWLPSPYHYPWGYVERADQWLDRNCRLVFPRRGWGAWGAIGTVCLVGFFLSFARALPSGEGLAGTPP